MNFVIYYDSNKKQKQQHMQLNMQQHLTHSKQSLTVQLISSHPLQSHSSPLQLQSLQSPQLQSSHVWSQLHVQQSLPVTFLNAAIQHMISRQEQRQSKHDADSDGVAGPNGIGNVVAF